VLRQRCDARGFTPLRIENIGKREVAQAFEPQKLSRVDGPARATSEDGSKRGCETGSRGFTRSGPPGRACKILFGNLAVQILLLVPADRPVWLNRRMEMKNALLIATAFLALAVGAQQTLAQERTVRFLCHAPTGHTCQYRVRTAAGPVDFALPSGERREVAGVTPLVDKHCVCDPGPVTSDCKAPQLGYWCLGHWSKVKRPPEFNSRNDAIEGRFARE
jgi:hypothetical protein